MEPSSLVCGFPDIAGKSFEVAKYTPEGGRLPLLKVTQGGIVSIGGRVAIGTSGFGTPTPREQLHVIGKLTEIQELNARLERLANLMNPKNGGAK